LYDATQIVVVGGGAVVCPTLFRRSQYSAFVDNLVFWQAVQMSSKSDRILVERPDRYFVCNPCESYVIFGILDT
jgi:hypothetical protein